MGKKAESPNGVAHRRTLDGYSAYGNSIFEVKHGLAAVRGLRASVLSLAYALRKEAHIEGYLILVDPKISPDRLHAEWEDARHTLSETVGSRLRFVISTHGQYTGLPDNGDKTVEQHIRDLILTEPEIGTRLPRADYFFVVLKILLIQRLLKRGPVTTLWLTKTAGCTYPTVFTALGRLGRAITRLPDRRVELSRFPKEAWLEILAVSKRVRETVLFRDQSGRPRTPDDLVHRLQAMDRHDIALGGTLGARHWYPALDVHGNPRLDLAVHCPGKRLDLSFVEGLDAALTRVEDPVEPVAVAIHVVRRSVPMFEPGPKCMSWADPVECLLDLHEMRLESQALELLRSFEDAEGGR